ncbi:hypothetical protein KIN20_033300 [Parelaphostrongylus tenuis]|uniref:Uncharacterized protein n=1 Tax=Parelaphostrongylus tenuis TaxID=148309 RepID=A0AAD5WI51_PARTN|nr:hypothetical protein KIN20_033300 [Parelaphostrongylus tenuis]
MHESAVCTTRINQLFRASISVSVPHETNTSVVMNVMKREGKKGVHSDNNSGNSLLSRRGPLY